MTTPIWITPAGLLASYQESDLVSIDLDYTAEPGAILTVIAGSLPNGLTMSTIGHIGGTLDLKSVPQTFNFAVRITDGTDFADRTFSISVLDIAPQWTTNSDLNLVIDYPQARPLKPNNAVSINLSVSDPGGIIKEFVKIQGTMPPGLSINQFGQIVGITEIVTELTVYEFTIRALLDGDKFVDRDFTFAAAGSSA
jgi:hypothetical protein